MAADDDGNSTNCGPRPDPAGSVSSDSVTFHTTRNFTVLRTTTAQKEPNMPRSVSNDTSELNHTVRNDMLLVPDPTRNETTGVPNQEGTATNLATPHHSNITVQKSRDPEGSVSYSSGFRVQEDPTPSVGNIPTSVAPSIAPSILQQEEEIEQQLHVQIGEICATASDNVSSVGNLSLSDVHGWQRLSDASMLQKFSKLPSNVRLRLTDSFAC